MIYGVGIDSVHVERMDKNIQQYGDRFARKILNNIELEQYKKSARPANFLAKHFAAKEAMSKALGTGFQNGILLKNMTVIHDANGKPGISCEGKVKDLLSQNQIGSSHLSITDEKDYAFACVVLEQVSL